MFGSKMTPKTLELPLTRILDDDLVIMTVIISDTYDLISFKITHSVTTTLLLDGCLSVCHTIDVKN
jgi:hypothetical protein